MANSAASGQTITTTPTNIFTSDDGGGDCTVVMVRNDTGSPFPLRVEVPGLHVAGEGIVLAAGEKEHFRIGLDGITKVIADGVGGSATASWAVVARNK